MKKIIMLSTVFFTSLLKGYSQTKFCDSVALAMIAEDVSFAQDMQFVDSPRNSLLFNHFQSVVDTTTSKSSSQVVLLGARVILIDAVSTFPDLVEFGGWDYHLWSRAHVGCPTLVQGRDGVVIRLRYKVR